MLDGSKVIDANGRVQELNLSLPGRANRSNAVMALALMGCVYLVIRNVNDVLGKNKTFRVRFRKYFGRDFDTFQTHEKKFPGYDLASLHRALASFREALCSEMIDIGGTNFHTLRDLFENLKQPNSRSLSSAYSMIRRVARIALRESRVSIVSSRCM